MPTQWLAQQLPWNASRNSPCRPVFSPGCHCHLNSLCYLHLLQFCPQSLRSLAQLQREDDLTPNEKKGLGRLSVVQQSVLIISGSYRASAPPATCTTSVSSPIPLFHCFIQCTCLVLDFKPFWQGKTVYSASKSSASVTIGPGDHAGCSKLPLIYLHVLYLAMGLH